MFFLSAYLKGFEKVLGMSHELIRINNYVLVASLVLFLIKKVNG